MATLQEVVEAYRAIRQAELRYAKTLRAALASGVTQADLARALGHSREKLRQDAMDDEQRLRIRQADAERKRNVRIVSRGRRR